MLSELKKYRTIFTKKTFTLVEVIFGSIVTYNILLVSKRGDALTISSNYDGLEYDTLIKKLSKNQPVIVHFSGKNIINKKVASSSNYSKEILFGASFSDFYIFEVKQGDFNFVSVARRELIDTVLQNFKISGLYIVDFAFGPFVNVLLSGIISKDTLKTKGFTVFLSDGKLKDFEENMSESSGFYQIGDHNLNGVHLSLFATLLNYLYPSEYVNHDVSSILDNKNEFKLRRIFSVLGAFVLSFFLVSLLVSYVIYDYNTDKYFDYQKQLHYLNSTYEQVKGLEKEKDRKQAIVNESGVLSNHFITEYLYDIGVSVPNAITLSNLEFNPLTKKIKDSELILINKGIIRVSGKTKSSKELNEWLVILKKMNWLKNVEIRKFLRNRDNGLQFDLEIVYK